MWASNSISKQIDSRPSEPHLRVSFVEAKSAFYEGLVQEERFKLLWCFAFVGLVFNARIPSTDAQLRIQRKSTATRCTNLCRINGATLRDYRKVCD
jgi:hypothetical protein